MEFHKPKPVHSWRELLGEIGVIVVGVVIALSAEQLVESLHWKHRVAEAETAMRRELGDDIAYAAEQQRFKACVGATLERMQAAVREGQPQKLRRLAQLQSPFNTRPWRADSWNAALTGQITDHIPRDTLTAFGFAFRSVATERERQFAINDHYAELIGGAAVETVTPEVAYAMQTALEKLRKDHDLTLIISTNLLNLGKELDITASAIPRGGRRDHRQCEKDVRALPV